MQNIPIPLNKSLTSTRVKHFPRGQIILYEGDNLEEVYILKAGVIKLYDINTQGDEKILHIIKPPAIIPFAFLSAENRPTSWFYCALTDCDLYVMPKLKLENMMNEDSILAAFFIKEFSRDVHELIVRLSSLGKTKARGKIVSVLKFLIVCHGVERRSGWWRIPFIVNHQLLANMAGVTRESTSKVMMELQDKKIVRNPRFTILEINKEKLLVAK